MRKTLLILIPFIILGAIGSYFFLQPKPNSDYIPKRDRPDLAAEHEFQMTKDPSLGYVPIQRKVEAYKTTKQLLAYKAQSRSVENVLWEERGPNNLGGRTRALMYDPNDPTGKKVFAGGVGGGIWYNNDITNEETQWNNVNDFLANLAISTIAYDPSQTNIFYVGTGLGFTGRIRGAGIWRSNDAGTSWTQLESTTTGNFNYVQKIVVNASGRVIAGTNNGLFISDDNGTSWTQSRSGFIADIELASDGTVYASNLSGGIFISTDNGASFESISPGDNGERVELAVAPSDPQIVYALAATGGNIAWMKKTTNSGTSWSDITIPRYREQNCEESENDFARGQAWFDLIAAVYPNDPNKLIIGGIDLYRSTNGGNSWELISYWTGGCDDYVHADQHAIILKNDNEGIFGNDGGVYYSETLNDSDPDFHERNNHYITSLFYSCGAANLPLDNTYIAGAQDNGAHLFSKDGLGESREVTGGDGAYVFIDQDDPNIMISSYVYNVYQISTNRGASFQRFSNDQSSGRFINPADYDDEANILYAAGNSNQLKVYSGIGTSITSETKTVSVSNRILTHLRSSPYSDNTIFVGNDQGDVYKITSANTSPSVTQIDNNAFPNGYISSIEIGANENELIVTLSNYGVISVWYTSNGGEEWSNVEGNLPDIPVNWALFNPNNRSEVLLATDVGIWGTNDITAEAVEWLPTVEGLANVKCTMLQYRDSDNQVIVSTFGRGLFTSNTFLEGSLANFKTDSKVIYEGTTVSFSNNSYGEVNDVLWQFEKGKYATDINPSHKFDYPGKYKVLLSINQGTSSFTRDIAVLPKVNAHYDQSLGGDFEINQADFFADNIAGSGFSIGNSTIEGKDGTSSGDNAWVLGIEDEQYIDNSEAHLYTPAFNFLATGNYTLSFETKYQFEDQWDGFILEYSTDLGETWTKLNPEIVNGWYQTSSDPQSVFGNSVPFFSGSTNGEFVTKSTDVSFLAENEHVAFRFVFKSDAAVTDIGMAIDNFEITAPSQVVSANFINSLDAPELCSSSSVIFYDQSEGSIASYEWNFGNGASPATASGKGPHIVSYNVTGTPNIKLTVTGTGGDTDIIETADFSVTSSTESEIQLNIASAICYNETAAITVFNTANEDIYSIYDDNNEPISTFSGNGDNLTVMLGPIVENKNYLIEQLSADGCINTSSFEIEITGPTPKEVITGNTDVCQNDTYIATIQESAIDTRYALVAENATGISDTVNGNSSELVISSFALTSDTTAQIIALKNNCSLFLLDNYEQITVSPFPGNQITDDSNGNLTADAGASYQWFLNGEAIEGANARIHRPEQFGEYTVEVTNSLGCSILSESYSPTVLSAKDLIKQGKLALYPNPASTYVTLENDFGFTSYQLYSVRGKLKISKTNLKQKEKIDVSDLATGTYILELVGNGHSIKTKIAVK
jgi:hypothetical protein